jgi:hypothetical protein
VTDVGQTKNHPYHSVPIRKEKIVQLRFGFDLRG